MAKRKPAQPKEAVLLRLPEEEVAILKQLASQSLHADGSPMSVNQYCGAILANAAQKGVLVQEKVAYEVNESPTARLTDEDDAPATYQARPKKKSGPEE